MEVNNYTFSPRDNANRATLTINGRKVGRVHFRVDDAWLNPYKTSKLKSMSNQILIITLIR